MEKLLAGWSSKNGKEYLSLDTGTTAREHEHWSSVGFRVLVERAAFRPTRGGSFSNFAWYLPAGYFGYCSHDRIRTVGFRVLKGGSK
jgi:hypothetical protein